MTYRSRILSKAFTAAISGVCAIMLPVSAALAVDVSGPDMQCVIKEADKSALTEGQENVVEYTITVKNIGDFKATDVSIGDSISGSVNAAITSAVGCTDDGTTASCDIGEVAAGAEVMRTIVVTAGSPQAGQSLTNIATVISPNFDLNPNNNGGAGTACEVVLNVPVTPNPALACLSKDADPTLALPGDDVTYTIDLKVAGNVPSENVTLTDALPAGINYVSAQAVGGGTCSEDEGTVTCTYGDLNPGDTRSAVIVVAVANDAAPQTIKNTATVDATNAATDDDDTCSATISIEPPEEGLACRVTGGGIDKFGDWDGSWGKGHAKNNADETDYYTFGGQAGANTAMQPDPKGEWTHHQQRGPNGSFIFHAGTASAPEATEITAIECSDPGYCDPARPAPAKQIDFNGVGSFKNMKNSPLSGQVTVGSSLHHFSVHIEDLGEPGRSGKQPPAGDQCPVGGSYGLLADCDCPDFYRLTVHATTDPASAVIYEVFGYIDGGNLQIHPPTGFDQNAGN